MPITLTQDQEARFIHAVGHGRYESTSDAMDAALELLDYHNQFLSENRVDLDKRIREIGRAHV